MPLVSIIVPVYNTEKQLEKCVNSLLNQTLKDIEIILVDDGSPDNSPKICDDFKLKDSRIKVIHKENGGLSSARNAALDIALKALDISQSVNINNNYFTLILNKLIGEIYLALQDFDAAKMYIEKAIMIAKSSDIKYQLAHLYLLYSKYLQDYALTIQDKKVDYILSAQQMNQKASSIADELKLISLMSEVEKATTILNSFCQMNGIVLK